jgi:endogenous inhibitor of DNA gyrase (YacG/DUF329 family)
VRKCPTCKRRIPEANERAAGHETAPALRGGASIAAATAPPLPFCSQRCKLADLHGWLSGRYVVSDALPLGDSDALPGEDE